MSEPASDPETEHVVTVPASGVWAIRHPPSESAGTDLSRCPLYLHMEAEMADYRGPLGRYRARLLDTGIGPVWTWELLAK